MIFRYTGIDRVQMLWFAARSDSILPRWEWALRTVSKICLFIAFAFWFEASVARGQDSVSVAMQGVTVTAVRTLGGQATTPLSRVSFRRSEFDVQAEPGVSLEQTLRGIPGLFISDRNHFAVGERVIVRGMGSRAPFGVRGVQIVLDGIPLTLPDGQSVADMIDPAMISRGELIRGPASVFWGNGSGGVLMLTSSSGPQTHSSRVRLQTGSDGLRQVLGETRFSIKRHQFNVFGSTVSRDGYRDHSAGRFTRGAIAAVFNLSSRTMLRFRGAGADQDVEHPGSLNRSELEADPKQANASYELQKAGKKSWQIQLGSELLTAWGPGFLSLSSHWIRRTLRNPLPFAFIDLDRTAGGADLSYQYNADRFSVAAGTDLRFQSDSRQNWDTVAGERGAELALDQRENVLNASARTVLFYSPTNRLGLAAGVRWDYIRFRMDDHRLGDGDESGERAFESVNPVLGISYRIPALTLYADVGSAFETPTTTELVNRPGMTGGFNPDLQPQKTVGIEAGMRASLEGGALSVDVAVYRLNVTDRLVSFQTVEGGDRTFFRNGGRNTHKGVEGAMTWQLVPGALLEVMATVGRFDFKESDLSGNRLPGVPEKQVSASLTVTPGLITGRLNVLRVDGYFVDDANSAQVEGYTLLDVTLGYDGFGLKTFSVRPFLSVTNLTDQTYVSSVTINATAGRYFDPGSGRTIQAGINVLF